VIAKKISKEKISGFMKIPTLDLHGLKHHEVPNVVARFIEDWLEKGLFIDIITGNSDQMLLEAVKVIQQYGLEYMTGLPAYQGKVRVVMYDEYH
tara:strand:+ start:132 stop:413 length:282 start_codon:yes stop_codon:yes gene_type:complete